MSLERYTALIEQSEPKLEVRSILGTGGWGNVFEAWNTGLDRAVAVKVIHAEIISNDPQAWQRFLREAMILSRLTHKNIVRIYSFGRLVDSSPFITMELLKGIPMSEHVKNSRLTLEVFKDVFMQTCDALKCLHDNDVLHRDLKTSNIMLVKDERGHDLVKLMDFGLALDHSIAGGDMQRLTSTGEVVGTAAYMSPEQCLGKLLDKRSDIYSLGCILYESLMGQPPFVSDSSYSCMMMHVADDPPALNYSSEDKAAVESVNRIIQRCLEKDAADRYQSAEELRDDLDAIFRSRLTISASLPRAKSQQQHRTNPVSQKTAIAFVVTLIAVGGLAAGKMTMQNQQDQDVPPRQATPDKDDGYHFPAGEELVIRSTDDTRLSPDAYHFPLIEKLLLQGKNEKALAEARILAETRTTQFSQELLAKCLSKCNKDEEAIALMDRIIRTHPETQFRATRSSMLYNVGRYSECIRDLDLVIPYKRRHAGVWLALRGLAHFHTGNNSAASADFAAAIEANAVDRLTYFERQGEVRQALAEISRKAK